MYNLNRQNGQTIAAPPDVFTNAGTLSLFNPRFPFYPEYVEKTRKPFMFSETGSAINYDKAGRTSIGTVATIRQEVESKQSWWNAVLDSSVLAAPNTKLSRLKAAVWFEERKDEASYENPAITIERDYRITYNETVRNAFMKDMQQIGDKISYAGKFEFSCNGGFKFVR